MEKYAHHRVVEVSAEEGEFHMGRCVLDRWVEVSAEEAAFHMR